MNDHEKRLLLFDIDGTLIRPGKGARTALKKAIFEITDVAIKNFMVANCAGKTDRLIIWNVLKRYQYPEEKIKPKIDTILERYLELLEISYNKNNDAYLLPGVYELIHELSNRKNTYLGLLTGNAERGARKKLSPFNINHFFKFGAFGSDGFYRNELPPIAKKRGEEYSGTTFRDDEIFVIGDTPSDVECGKILNAKTIGINTFTEFYEELVKSKPDFIFDGFEDTKAVLNAIYGS